jgi:hypothetical protein
VPCPGCGGRSMIYQRESIEGPLQATMETISSVCCKYGKAYCYPSQETLLRLVEEYHGVKMCRRTLNRVLRWLVDHRYIERVRRHRAGPDGKILFATTLYLLKKKIFMRLNSIRKWAERVSSPLRVPLRAQYRSLKQNEIFKVVAPDVDKLWKASLEGGPKS